MTLTASYVTPGYTHTATQNFDYKILAVIPEFFDKSIEPVTVVAGEDFSWSLPLTKVDITINSVTTDIGSDIADFIKFEAATLTFDINGSNSANTPAQSLTVAITMIDSNNRSRKYDQIIHIVAPESTDPVVRADYIEILDTVTLQLG